MEFIFFLNAIVFAVIAVFLIVQFLKKRNDENVKNFLFLFFLVGILYLISMVFSSLWFFNILNYNPGDFFLIYSFIIFLQTILLFIFFYKIKKNKKVFVLLLFYLATASTFFVSLSFPYVLSLTSFLLTLLLFLFLVSVPEFEKFSGLGILYASLSIVFQILILFNENSAVYFAFFSGIAFLIFLWRLIKTFEYSPDVFFSIQKPKKESSFIIDFLKYFIFIITLTNFLFIGTISLHEVGHLSAGKIAGCSLGKIVYEEGGLPHTEILCKNDNTSIKRLVFLGGMVFPILVALLFLFAGGTFIKESALLVIGFNFIISYKDLLDFGLYETIPLFFLIIGLCFALIGIFLLARSRTTEKEFISIS